MRIILLSITFEVALLTKRLRQISATLTIMCATNALYSQLLPVPTIDSVTVQADDKILVSWSVASDQRVNRFVIYKKTSQDFGYIAIDTVEADKPMKYTDHGVDAINKQWFYTVSSLSASDSISGLAIPHSNITFTFGQFNLCRATIDANWKQYNGITDVRYSTVRRVNGQFDNIIQHFDNTHGAIAVINGTTQLIAVRATWNGGSSTSAFRPYTADTIRVDDKATVLEIKDMGVEYKIRVGNVLSRDIDTVLLYVCRNGETTPFERYALKHNSGNEVVFTINKRYNLVNVRPAVKDICGNEYSGNQAVETIYLHAAELNNDITFTWNEVKSVQNLSYKLFKGGTEPEIIESFSSGGLYTYTLATDMQETGKVLFYIEASDDTLSITSNLVEIMLYDDLMWPNAFIPDRDGNDEIFRPVVKRFEPDSFVMRIYSKNGETIFVSDNRTIGWDGTYNGVLVKKGAYIWHAEYFIAGKKHNRKGTVNVLY